MGSDVGLASRTHRPEPAYIRWGLPPSPAPEAWALSALPEQQPQQTLQMCFFFLMCPGDLPSSQSWLSLRPSVRSPPIQWGDLRSAQRTHRDSHTAKDYSGLRWGGGVGQQGALVGDTHGCGLGCHS